MAVSDFNMACTNRMRLAQLNGMLHSCDITIQEVLEGLTFFISELEEDFNKSGQGFEQMFKILKNLITSGTDKTKDGVQLREALIAGVISPKTKKIKSEIKPKKERHKTSKDVSDISSYAKNHKSREIVDKFGFSSVVVWNTYARTHKIVYKKQCQWDKKGITEMAKTKPIKEMVVALGVDYSNLRKYLLKNKIPFFNNRGWVIKEA